MSHIFRSFLRKSMGGTIIPVSPCIGSAIIVPMLLPWLVTNSSILSSSLYELNLTPSKSGKNDLRYFSLYVTDSAPNVFPWYAPFNAIIPFLLVYFLENLMAASTDSVPLFEKNTLLRFLGVIVKSLFKNSNLALLYKDI